MKTALIVAPHPDDAELAMGGSIARMITTDWSVCIVDLTDGEPTPFGSKQIRAKETQQASDILGIKERICLDMPNRNLELTLQNRRKLAEVIRLHNPDILFAPAMPDRHPDHKAALELTEAARFEAKYHKTDLAGEPYWSPKMWLYYSPHRQDFAKPSVIMDISDVWEKKLTAIKAYQSQLKNSSCNGTYSLLAKIEITAKYFGQCINVAYGEPFVACEPVSITSFESLT
ncbi:MAG: bacillithiol biosynthesis deacetylase BshB1 [Planctomycetota bacterium]|jgi:bacillithiol biosynthesis deacetylase BshB1